MLLLNEKYKMTNASDATEYAGRETGLVTQHASFILCNKIKSFKKKREENQTHVKHGGDIILWGYLIVFGSGGT